MENKNSYVDMQSLIQIANLIYKKYVEIYELELDGKENVELYQKKLNELERLIALEESMYKNLDTKTLGQSIKHYIDMFTEDKLASELKDVYASEKTRLIERRIFRRIVKSVELANNSFSKLQQPEIIGDALKRDFIKTLLAIINEYINNEHFKDIREYFINLKYNIAFIYGNIERDLLNSKFRINSRPVWLHESVAKDIGIDENVLVNMNLTEMFNIMNYFIAVINNLYNYDLNDPVLLTTGITAGAFLRTANLFAHESLRNNLLKMFNIEEYEDMELWEASNPAEMLGVSLSRYECDKDIPIKVDLNLG